MIALRHITLATDGCRGVQRDVRREEVGSLVEAASLLAAARDGREPVISCVEPRLCTMLLTPSSRSRRCLTIEILPPYREDIGVGDPLATIGIALRATCARAVWRALGLGHGGEHRIGPEDRAPAVPWVAVRHHGVVLPWVDALALRLAWAAMEGTAVLGRDRLVIESDEDEEE